MNNTQMDTMDMTSTIIKNAPINQNNTTNEYIENQNKNQTQNQKFELETPIHHNNNININKITSNELISSPIKKMKCNLQDTLTGGLPGSSALNCGKMNGSGNTHYGSGNQNKSGNHSGNHSGSGGTNVLYKKLKQMVGQLNDLGENVTTLIINKNSTEQLKSFGTKLKILEKKST
jgi:hypothetical protein